MGLPNIFRCQLKQRVSLFYQSYWFFIKSKIIQQTLVTLKAKQKPYFAHCSAGYPMDFHAVLFKLDLSK